MAKDKKKKHKVTIWMMVTEDKYRLPVKWGESAEELANILGISPSTIWSCVSMAKKTGRISKYIKVEITEGGK